MVKHVVWLFLFCVSAVHAANDTGVLERVLVEQEVVFANQKMSLKVSLTSRNLWYQQGLTMMLDLTSTKEMPSLSAQLLMTAAQPWQDMSMQSEPEQHLIDSVVHYRWQAIVFPKQLGVQDLPILRLRLEGTGGAQKTISLPSLSVYVRSLPVYVPAEAWVGKADTQPMVQHHTPWVLVGDQQVQTWQWRVQGLWSKAVNLPVLSGQGITGLQPWFKVEHEWLDGQYWTKLSVQQPWVATEAGHWTVARQDFWLFDAQTGRVQHWQLTGSDGIAIAPWLWRIMQGIILLMATGLLMMTIRFIRCRLYQHRYRQGIIRAADAQQLLQWLHLHWHLNDDIPLAHQAKGLPIEAELIALEALLFSSLPLYDAVFVRLRDNLAKRAVPSCH